MRGTSTSRRRLAAGAVLGGLAGLAVVLVAFALLSHPTSTGHVRLAAASAGATQMDPFGAPGGKPDYAVPAPDGCRPSWTRSPGPSSPSYVNTPADGPYNMSYLNGSWSQLTWPVHAHVDHVSEMADRRLWNQAAGAGYADTQPTG